MKNSDAQTRQRLIKEQSIEAERQAIIRQCRSSFWIYCKIESPKFYRDDRWHLRLLCEVLQAFYERRLDKAVYRELCETYAPAWYVERIDFDSIIDDHIFTRIMTNIPPRLGKSRTLVNFCKWVFGRSTKNRVITGSYNNDLAQTFSRYTRDGICQLRNKPTEIVYADIFPGTKIKRGNAGYKEWALEGEFFNYRGTGVMGTITGKGGNIQIVDDPIKGALEAFNEEHLEKVWSWYTGTFLSRLEDGDAEQVTPAELVVDEEDGLQIMNMTRWAAGDPCGRILAGPEAAEWLVLLMEAGYGEQPVPGRDNEQEPVHMLCPSLLSKRKYLSLRRNMDQAIFNANYHQVALDQQGRLYQSFKTYEHLPTNDAGQCVVERIIAYGDTADEGDDFFAMPVAAIYQKQAYILDFLYTKAAMEITEPAAAEMLVKTDCGTAHIESNNGGRGFTRNVERILRDVHKSHKPSVNWFHQSKNKQARILSNATYVTKNVFWPIGWQNRWPELYKALSTYQREGKNKHDDAPDAVTGLVEQILEGNTGWLDFAAAEIERMKEDKR